MAYDGRRRRLTRCPLISPRSVDVSPPGEPGSRSLALYGAPSPKDWLTGSHSSFKSKGNVSREPG